MPQGAPAVGVMYPAVKPNACLRMPRTTGTPVQKPKEVFMYSLELNRGRLVAVKTVLKLEGLLIQIFH
jgi:hypothetical protein